ncbi:LysR family transcriptional regulator [Komagataeibacter rhaeticus]
MDLIKAMTVFARVVEGKSITAGAARCNISVTMASNYIKQLEHKLNTSLFSRTTRKLSLTAPGDFYYSKCVEILNLVEVAERGVVQNNASLCTTIKISSAVTFGSAMLPRIISEFSSLHPDVRFDVSLNDEIVNLVEHQVDFAFRIGHSNDKDLVIDQLAPYKLVVVGSPSYFLRMGYPRTPDDLSLHDCLTYRLPWGASWESAQKTWSFGNGVAFLRRDVNARIQMSDARGIHRAVVEGMGLAILPRILVVSDLENGKLEEAFPSYNVPSRRLDLVSLKRTTAGAACRIFRDFVLEWFKLYNGDEVGFNGRTGNALADARRR